MSLEALPEDALARVCAHLRARDRTTLSRTCRSLRDAMAPRADLWRDVLRHRYGVAVVDDAPAHAECTLREAAVDALCYDGAWRTLEIGTGALVACTPGAAGASGAGGSVRAFVAHANGVVQITPTQGDWAQLQGRPTAMAVSETDNRVAVAWDRAVSVYDVDDDGTLRTTRPLRGHNKLVHSVSFLGTMVVSGGADGAIRLHHAETRRTRGVLRKHAGAVVQLVTKDGKLMSRSGERIVVWDAATVRPVRGFPGGFFATTDGDTIYALAPGDGCSVRVYDVRTRNVEAVLSLPRAWSRMRVADLALTEANDVISAVGDGGIAHWPGRGRWEARSLVVPRRRPPVRPACVCIRGEFALVASAGAATEIVAASLTDSTVVRTPWPDREGGAFTQLINVGDTLIGCRERSVAIFDHRSVGATLNRNLLAESGASDSWQPEEAGKFWQTGALDDTLCGQS